MPLKAVVFSPHCSAYDKANVWLQDLYVPRTPGYTILIYVYEIKLNYP